MSEDYRLWTLARGCDTMGQFGTERRNDTGPNCRQADGESIRVLAYLCGIVRLKPDLSADRLGASCR